MGEMNETRTTAKIGNCPACLATLEIVLRVELGASKVEALPGGHTAVKFEFAQPHVTGAVLKPHDCMRKDEPVTRQRTVPDVLAPRAHGRIMGGGRP